MNSKQFITIKSLSDIIQLRSMLSHVLVCTMLSKINLRKLLSTLRELIKSSQKKWNGSSWLPHATEEWTFSTKLLKFTKISMLKLLITLTVWEV